jgi:hypothetical protein
LSNTGFNVIARSTFSLRRSRIQVFDTPLAFAAIATAFDHSHRARVGVLQLVHALHGHRAPRTLPRPRGRRAPKRENELRHPAAARRRLAIAALTSRRIALSPGGGRKRRDRSRCPCRWPVGRRRKTLASHINDQDLRSTPPGAVLNEQDDDLTLRLLLLVQTILRCGSARKPAHDQAIRPKEGAAYTG